jgi:pantoate kinase
MVEEAQTFTENTIFMTERLGLMVEEAQTFTENTIFMTERLGLMVEEDKYCVFCKSLCFLYH